MWSVYVAIYLVICIWWVHFQYELVVYPAIIKKYPNTKGKPLLWLFLFGAFILAPILAIMYVRVKWIFFKGKVQMQKKALSEGRRTPRDFAQTIARVSLWLDGAVENSISEDE